MPKYSRSKIGGMALARMGFTCGLAADQPLETGVDLRWGSNQLLESGFAGAEVSLTASRAAST